jgi:hypothetical protein
MSPDLNEEIHAAFPKEWMAIICVTAKDEQKFNKLKR